MEKIYILKESGLRKMIEERVKDLQQQANGELERRISEKESNLATMQSQMNPHFIYNALEGIRGQAILDNAPIIADISQALADYFRYFISSRKDIATLSEELSNVKNYLRVQQFRFDNRFRMEIHHDPSDYQALETLLPKLTLQPIIENAIAHGFAKSKDDAKIEIRIVFTQKSVNITISDNGVGMDVETLMSLNDDMNHQTTQSQKQGRHNGVAMPNIQKRIQLMFGEDYGIHVSSMLGIGTDVEIHLPFCTSIDCL